MLGFVLDFPNCCLILRYIPIPLHPSTNPLLKSKAYYRFRLSRIQTQRNAMQVLYCILGFEFRSDRSTMLANHFQDGIVMARFVWSQIPNSEESQLFNDTIGIIKKNDRGNVESIDYKVIEIFAYREEQVQ
ncbi:hypothetical protein VNO78_20777 [Psophocarpus tetragonolobus]|uniref:Uncharacterized protein n=1 Tax=Psophocarpus tetragonolobus TaxID=3891 RepID=A0AAN9SDZ7_PSOTE